MLKRLWTDKCLLVRSLKISLSDVQNNFDILFLQRTLTNDANKQNIESKNRQHSQSIHLRCFLFLKSWQNPWKINVKEFAVSKVVGSRPATLLKKLFHRYFSNMFGKYLWWSSVLVMLQASGLQFYWKTTLSQELSKDFAKIIQETPSPNFIHGIIMGYSRKKTKQGGGSWGHAFLNRPWNFSFFYFTPGNFRENKAPPLEIPQNCLTSLGNSKAKNQDHWKFFIIFSWTPLEIPLCFNPWKFHMLFLWYPWKFHIISPRPLFFFFSGIAHGLFWKKNKPWVEDM